MSKKKENENSDDRSKMFVNLPAEFAQARREEAKKFSLCVRCLEAGNRVNVSGLSACPLCGCKTSLIE